jgi:2-polyprenyl-3-methyl-5-hydroxy-6-metoxy-1,4-benzoquinol methylase
LRQDMKEIFQLHRHGSRGTRVRLRGRHLLCDMDLIEQHVPTTGTIVDIGCGYGFFSNLMAVRSAGRDVLGIDIEPEKIGHARASIGGRPNIDFALADAFDFPYPPCDAITILDITYLMPEEEQRRLLEVCKLNLKPGGKLVWKTQETRPRWKYAFMYAQELAGSLVGMTSSGQKSFHFMSRPEAMRAMEEAGFSVKVVEMPTRLPYCEVLFIGS